MKKVICIDASYPKHADLSGMKKLQEGATYHIRSVETYGRGVGYLLAEVYNTHFKITDRPGMEPGYSASRFIECSDIDECAMVEVGENANA